MRVVFERHVDPGGRRAGRHLLLQADVGGIEPADDRFQPEELSVDDERQRHVLLGGRGFDLRVPLHGLDHVAAVHLQDLVDVCSGNLQRNQHLDHELVARRRHEVWRRSQPIGQLAAAGGRDPVALARPLAFLVVGLDESVPLEPLECRIDLPDVQRPDLARPRLELVLQPQAVLRALGEQREEGVRDAQSWSPRIAIPSSILSIETPRKSRPGRALVGRIPGSLNGAGLGLDARA